MKHPWMPLYIADYLTDTVDLSPDQHGTYIVLLLLAWRQKGVLPNDMKMLKRMLAGCMSDMHGNRFNRLVPPILKRFFYLGEDGQWHQMRLEKELEKSEKLSRNAKEKAEKRWAKINEVKDLADAPASTLHCQSHSQHKERKKEPSDGREATRPSVPRVKQRKRYDEKFVELWTVYPKRQGENPKAPAEKHFRSAVSSGADPDTIIAAVKRYGADLKSAGKWGTQYVAQAVTWLKQRRWEGYAVAAAALLTPHGHLALDGILHTPRPANPREGII